MKITPRIDEFRNVVYFRPMHRHSHYGLLVYKAHPMYNVGDYIQSIAAAQFLPRVDRYINRERLNSYNGDPLKLILNGWFMHHPGRWPPSPNIDPLLISFHLNSQAKKKLLLPKSVEWFARHAPVGCRDPYTLEAMQEKGIESYLSGCLTSTLKNKWNYRTNDVYFVDVLHHMRSDFNVLNPVQLIGKLVSRSSHKRTHAFAALGEVFDGQAIENAISIQHYRSATHPEHKRFRIAKLLLQKYATAKLVVTSRLHCALPCLAFGTPVIFVETEVQKPYDSCRLEGVTQLFNTLRIDGKGNINSNFELPGKIQVNTSLENPRKFMEFVPRLENTCRSFIHEARLPV